MTATPRERSVTPVTESEVEAAALDWLEGLGWEIAHGPDIGPGGSTVERGHYGVGVLERRLREALARLNAGLPAAALEDAARRLMRPQGTTLESRNRFFHRMCTGGVTVEYRDGVGRVRGAQARVVDFHEPSSNDWLAVNQFTVVEDGRERRPDIVLFLNGLPLAVVELKNPADEDATVYSAWRQLQTYKAEIPSLFEFNAVLAVSDGVEARLGTLTAGWEWFKPWRTIGGEELAPAAQTALQVAVEGVFEQPRFLALVRDFLVVEDDGSGVLVKKMAGYHQFHAVQVAVRETLRAAALGRLESGPSVLREGSGRYESGGVPGGDPGDRRIGVVWHTQGSGKSLTMAFYAGRIVHEPAMGNPTVVVLTDRNDLDDQLFATCSRCRDLLGQPPVQAAGRADLRSRLAVDAGGVVFTTIQKFFPEQKGDRHPLLSRRRNVVVIADEAHRSQYEFIKGYARHMRDALPNASFIGFTGTPIEQEDANTRNVFGDYISVYDIRRSVEDEATVPIYYESRLAKLALDDEELPAVDAGFEEVTEGEEVERKENERGCLKVVMTVAASDPVDWQPHIRNKPRREALANRFRDPSDPLRMVLVRDMWLTGFDAPSLHTMYLDKPMRGHGLMQAIARVNRVFRDKPGGLVVDYLGLAHELKRALATYTESGGTGCAAVDQAEAVRAMLEKHEVCCALFHGFDWSAWTSGTPAQRLGLLPAAQEHVLAKEDGKERCLRAVRELTQAFALAVPHDEAIRIRDDVEFFQAVRSVLAKRTASDARPQEELDHALRQIVSRAVAPEGVVDIFAAAGLEKPDISILSEEFLSEVQGMKRRNLAVELLRKLLKGELAAKRKRNVVQARTFSEMLARTLRRYHNRAIEAAQVIQELIGLARELRHAERRGEDLGLSDDELAFYDALETNDSAVQVLGDETLRRLARELVEAVRRNVTIDWTLRENVRAHLRVLVKRILRKHGYPPDKQEQATRTVLEQAEVLSAGWSNR